MNQQWLSKDRDQAAKEFIKKEQMLREGILVLINQTVYHFESKKEWESQQAELLKNNPDQYALTNLKGWHEWLRVRGNHLQNSSNHKANSKLTDNQEYLKTTLDW